MEVNYHAPLVLRRELEVFAPPQMVWDWVSRVDLWKDWHGDISQSVWTGTPGPHGEFRLRIRKVLGVAAKVESWYEPRELGWVGYSWSTTWRQVIRLDGDFRRTLVRIEGSVEGRVYDYAPVRSVVSGQLVRLNEMWLGSLKTQLESEKFRAGRH